MSTWMTTLWSRLDPRAAAEARGERVVFERLRAAGLLEGLAGKRILEIGPKHGEDSLRLASLDPAELVLLDLPSKAGRVREWLPAVEARCPVRFVEGNLLYLDERMRGDLGVFDLVWCTGVLYHNAEQLRLVKRLFDLTAVDGLVVIESEIVPRPGLGGRNVVEIHWPDPWHGVPTMTHMPSVGAMRSWMEMVGFAEVRERPLYSWRLHRTRAVVTGSRPRDARPYVSYAGETNPEWAVGEAS